MRGEQALYTRIFPTSIEKLGTKHQRNALIDQQDDLIACRFYYHAHLCRLRYDDCLMELSREFFITPFTLARRLSLRADYLKELVAKSRTKAQLKKKYPWMSW